MATAQQLEALGELVRIEIELDPDEVPQRLIYALPRVIDWMSKVLPGLTTDGYFPGAAAPAEQAEALLYEVISGRSPSAMPPHCMLPNTEGIWELRTHDLRFFGFFWKRGVFVMTSAETKAKCLQVSGLASGHRNNAVQFRDRLDLDEPKFVPGSDPAHVL
jgi:hypothetical protein